jgi:hypothetical protein
MVSPAVITTTVKHFFQPKAYTFSRLHPEEDAFPMEAAAPCKERGITQSTLSTKASTASMVTPAIQTNLVGVSTYQTRFLHFLCLSNSALSTAYATSDSSQKNSFNEFITSKNSLGFWSGSSARAMLRFDNIRLLA